MVDNEVLPLSLALRRILLRVASLQMSMAQNVPCPRARLNRLGYCAWEGKEKAVDAHRDPASVSRSIICFTNSPVVHKAPAARLSQSA